MYDPKIFKIHNALLLLCYVLLLFLKNLSFIIRDNCNFVILFRQDDLNLKHVYNDFGVNADDVKFDEFCRLCLECWREHFGFGCISLEHEVNSGRYRKNFSEYLRVHI